MQYHLKDYKVRGTNIGFCVGGAPLGEGDLDLAACVRLIEGRHEAPRVFLEKLDAIRRQQGSGYGSRRGVVVTARWRRPGDHLKRVSGNGTRFEGKCLYLASADSCLPVPLGNSINS